jgi:hypothetical protein
MTEQLKRKEYQGFELCELCDENVWVEWRENMKSTRKKFYCKKCKLKIEHFGMLYRCAQNRNGGCTQGKPCLHRVHDPIFINGKYMFDNDIKGIPGQGKIGDFHDNEENRYYSLHHVFAMGFVGN